MKSIRIMKSAGKIILDYLYKKDITQADVAKMVNETPQNFGRKLRSSDMTVGMVVKISKALSHNFFEDIGNEWKRETFNIQNVINEPVAGYESNPASFDVYLDKIIEKKLNEKLKK